MNVFIENILDLIEMNGEVETSIDLSSFSCPQNKDIEDFFKYKAVDFAKRKLSVTYLITDAEDGQILGCFALTHKAISVPRINLSNTSQKKIGRYSRLDPSENAYTLSAFLIAQIGKNYSVEKGTRITGKELMDYAFDILSDIQHRIGGGVIYLDAEDKPVLTHFYENTLGFKPFGDRISEEDKTKYLQYMRFF